MNQVGEQTLQYTVCSFHTFVKSVPLFVKNVTVGEKHRKRDAAAFPTACAWT
jgi:hypothetical protein